MPDLEVVGLVSSVGLALLWLRARVRANREERERHAQEAQRRDEQ